MTWAWSQFWSHPVAYGAVQTPHPPRPHPRFGPVPPGWPGPSVQHEALLTAHPWSSADHAAERLLNAPTSLPSHRGLFARPQVLFADEPTGALDSLTGEHVMDLMVGAAREQGTTVILVTHEPRVAAYADREAIVRDGKATSLSPDRIAS